MGHIINIRRVARGATLVAAAAFLAAACGCTHHYDMRDFPVADSSAGGVTVKFKATMLDFGYSIPQIPRQKTIYMCEPWHWTVILAVTDARPQVPPLASGEEAEIVFYAPIRFFGTNDLKRGDTMEKTLRVWRGKDHFLHAVIGNDADVPPERPGRTPTKKAAVRPSP